MAFKNNQDNLINLKIVPFKLLFPKEYDYDSCFCIYKCYNNSDEYTDDIVCITGTMPKLTIGKEYSMSCEEVIHKTYGKQYKVISIESPELTSQEEEQNFLQTMVTESQYENIIKKYPMPISAINSGEFDYNNVTGYGEKTFEKLKEKIKINSHLTKALANLGRFGITYSQISKIVEFYGSSELAVQKVMEDPYVLYREIDGIGFIKADEIARSIGIKDNDPKRIHAVIMYVLEQNEQKGNTWMDIGEAHENAEKFLDFEINDFLSYIKEDKYFYISDDELILALSKTRQCEEDIVSELFRIADYPNNEIRLDDVIDIINETIIEIENELGIKYTDDQKELFYKINSNNIVILTGYAGTGKSFSLNGCLNMLDKFGIDYSLASPTAKAAKVITHYTGREARTIHRLLEWLPGGFTRNKTMPLYQDLIVIDETSMVDIWLFRSLLEAIPTGGKLLLIGDPAQLESVATGNVLHDIIKSYKFPVIKLEVVFRQALESGILSVATDIRQGINCFSKTGSSKEFGNNNDFKFWEGDKDDSAKKAIMIFKECLKKNTIDDIMLISPMKNGESGVKILNKLIQQIYNPHDSNKNELELKRCTFREGDRVIHIKNDYKAKWLNDNYEENGKTGVFNGDTGIIKEIDSNCVYVDYKDKIIEYNLKELNNLELAYCITCHKAQGSQSKVVICVLNTSHYMNLKRSLLYTAITRASDLFFLIADKKAITIAVNNHSLITKKTFLKDLLINSDNLDS